MCLVDLSNINGTHLFISWAMTLRQPVPAYHSIACPLIAAAALPALRTTCDYVVIDGSGYEDAEFSPVVFAADQTLLTSDHPRMDFACKPRVALWQSLARVASVMVALVRTSRHATERERDRHRIEALGFLPLQATLVDRVAYDRALATGRTVVQDDPTGLAAYELRCLAREIGLLRREPPPHAGRDRRPRPSDSAFSRAIHAHCFTRPRLR